VDPRAGLEAVVGESNSGRPVRSLAVSSISDSRKTRSVTFSVDLQYQASWKSMKRANGKYGVSIMHFYAFRTKDAHKKLNLFILIQPEWRISDEAPTMDRGCTSSWLVKACETP